MINLKDDGGKKAGFAHADGHAAAAELTSLRYVRPSYRLLRPRCRENLYPAGTSHFPRPWAGHVRRAARPFGHFGHTGRGNEKRWSRFSATLCVYQLIRCYSFTQRTGQELAFLASAFNCFSLKAVFPLSNASQYFGSVFSVAM